MSVVLANNLTKSYKDVLAVREISFDVQDGECYGLLGPNGAGKTTTLSMIRCACDPTDGQLKVFGMDVTRLGRRIRHRLGVVPQHNSLDPDLTVRENLITYASYFGLNRAEARRRADELLRFVTLEKKTGAKIDELSGGMRRRLLIARALINRPALLILDEPTSDLDPQARHHIWQRLRMLKAQGIPMILCTNSMDEAESLCDRLSLIDAGRILETGSPRELIARHAGEEVIELFGLHAGPAPAVHAILEKFAAACARIERAQDTVFCFSPAGAPIPTAFLEDARAARIPFAVRHATLEDVFLNLTGREL